MPVYVITGASRGLGFEWVRQLSRVASNIIVAAVPTMSPIPPYLLSLQQSSPATIHIVPCDTGTPETAMEFSNSLTTVLGTDGKIDYLINDAVITSQQPPRSSLALDADDLAFHINWNVLGPARVVAALLPYLRRWSKVINISSGLGSITRTLAMPFAVHTSYSISKAALNMLSVHQALDLRPYGIVVVALDPGFVRTDVTRGAEAALFPEESVERMLRTIHQLSEEDSGRFFTFSGRESAW
jgi:NAD(P)-dependent dehydrogenase (short-subunit alcohol dehydrogenase family)